MIEHCVTTEVFIDDTRSGSLPFVDGAATQLPYNSTFLPVFLLSNFAKEPSPIDASYLQRFPSSPLEKRRRLDAC